MRAKLSLLSFLLLFHNVYAFNITQVLSQYPDFSTFNNYLTQTNLASQINGRQTITVLAVENSNLSPLSGKSLDVLKTILSIHVILDYFDVPKLQSLSNRSTTVTTLFQTSGVAAGQEGFLNVTHLATDSIAFGSAVPGSTLGSNLIKSIASEPYNLSVLQVSNVIIPGPTNSPSPSAAPSASPRISPTPSMSPSMSPNVPSPTSPSMATATPSQAAAPSDAPSYAGSPSTSAAATPGSAPISNAPNATAPAADAPAANAPVADIPATDSPSPSTAIHVGLAVVFAGVLSTLSLASII